MKTVYREIIALVVGLTGVGLAAFGFNTVLDIGTCASGGPYVTARPCPDNASSAFWSAFGGVLLWVVGMFVSLRIFVPGAGQILWVVGFAGGGAATMIKVQADPTIGGDAKLGGTIMAVTFLANGLVVAIIGIVQLARRRTRGQGHRDRDRDRRTEAAEPRRTRSKFDDLNDLRSTGALTREEFKLLRADLDNTGPGESGVDRIVRLRRRASRSVSYSRPGRRPVPRRPTCRADYPSRSPSTPTRRCPSLRRPSRAHNPEPKQADRLITEVLMLSAERPITSVFERSKECLAMCRPSGPTSPRWSRPPSTATRPRYVTDFGSLVGCGHR